MTGTASSPRMIGRAAELDTLRAALAEGREGHPRAVVIRGEAGIGKTRLLQELIAGASARPQHPPLVVATGQCVDLGPIGAPFTPIRRLLHELYRAVGDEAFRRAAGTPVVVTTLSALVPEIAAEAPAPTGGADYVTEAIERVIENLSADHHLLLVIEDLHWADAATLALLKTLAGTLRGTHVTLVATYRSDDVGRGHPLRPVLAELERSRVVTGLPIQRLALADIAAQAEAILGRTPGDAELQALMGRSEGVPFFVEELVGHDEADLPDTLRDVVLARYEALTPAARRVVRVIAAGGVHVEHALVVAVHGGEAAELDDGIREATTANVIVSGDAGYTFRHALIQEAVHDELLPSERVDLHTRYAAELQRHADADEPALGAVIAEHWLIARDNVRAFDATVLALADARATHALTAAALLGERLLELWPQVPDAAARAGAERQVLALTVADDLWDAGDTARSARLVEEALELCPPEDRLTRARLLRLLAMLRFNAGQRGPGIIASLEEARSLVEGTSDPKEQAVLARVLAAFTLMAAADVDPLALLARAIDLATGSGDVDALGSVLIVRATARSSSGDVEGALADLRRAADVAESPGFRFQAINNMLDCLGLLGRYTEAVEIGEIGREQADAAGLERGNGAYIEANLGEALLALGRAPEGVRRLRRCVTLLQSDLYFRSFALRMLADHDVWDDRLDDAAAARARESAHIEQAVVDEDECIGWAVVDIDMALARRESESDPAVRVELARRAMVAAAVLAADEIIAVPGLSARLIPIAARAVAAASADRVDDPTIANVRALVEAAVAFAPDDERSVALASLARAELASGESASGEWRIAVAVLNRGFAPCWHRHYARYRLAKALVAEGNRDEAAVLLERVVAEAPSHGVAVAARWARELAIRAGLAIEGSDDAASRAAASGVSSLTPRELQVLALVAEGLTNPQIGARLFISPKTASVHVSAILAKIGAANRAEAAALYTAAGLVAEERA